MAHSQAPPGYWLSTPADVVEARRGRIGGPQRGGRRPRGRRHGCLLTLAVVLALLAIGIGTLIGHAAWEPSSNPPGSAPSTAPSQGTGNGSTAAGAPPNSAALAAAVSPSLVDINVSNSYQAMEAAGTGIVLSPDGLVLTNNHVVEGETALTATDVGNGQTYRGTVVGYDRSSDVAVVRLSGASGLTAARLGDSDTVAVGDGVVAVGNAQGAGGAPSHAGGSVTALGQTITAQDQANGTSEELHGLIETNADIVPGDSGGALIDGRARVIGMTTAGSSGYELGASANRGYAVPINQARQLANQIAAGTPGGTVHLGPTAFLGVEVRNPNGVAGAEIANVVAGGPADQAGLGTGDIITSIGGHPVTSPESLTSVLLGLTPGRTVTIGYLDPAGQSASVRVTLGAGPPQ